MRRSLLAVGTFVATIASFGFAPSSFAAPITTLGSVQTTQALTGNAYYSGNSAALWGDAIPTNGKIFTFSYHDWVDDGMTQATTGTITFDVWRPTTTAGEYQLIYSSDPVQLTDSDTIVTWSTGKRGLDVQQGDYFGVYLVSGSATLDAHCGTACAAGELYQDPLPGHTVGNSYAISGPYADYDVNVAVSFKARGKPA